MTIFHTVILGVIEGITEFLPVSSTAHLIIASRFLNIQQTDFIKLFEVFIQSGAILAVLIIYGDFLLKNKKIYGKLLMSFLPTAIVGFLLYRFIKSIFFETDILIIGALIGVGLLFLLIEYFVNNKRLKLSKSIDRINLIEAMIIGLVQALAVVPGVSRAGAVILAMMLMGYRRGEAATYSFLLAVPTILAASVFDLYKSREVLLSSQSNLFLLVIGFIVSFLVAYVAVKWLIGYLKQNSLVVFGFYRILLAIILLKLIV